ncbi:MAG: hypothetical protein KA713_12930 [Chryseotalea sp. WA131a]|jgi:hypothetical protein|nr:MAG: hypothetical protein KA713_12930 [Chryseotalea sp. WA131a]
MKSFSTLLMMVAMVGLISACFTEPDCIVTATMEVKIDFKQTKLNSQTNARSVVDTVLSFQSIQIAVGGKDTLFAANISAASLTLPIDPNQPSIKYTFVRKGRQANSPTVTEFITLSYANETRIISSKCGAFVYFLDLKVDDSSYGQTGYKLVNDRLLKNTSNVQIFF